MPSVIYVAIGLPGFIRCPVDANPPVTLVKWKKDGLPLRIDKVSWCGLGHLWVPSLASPQTEYEWAISSVEASCLHQAFIWMKIDLFSFISYCFLLVSIVPWLEPNGRWEHPCGRGDRGLSWHLYLHALQCPGLHGMVPSCSPGAKGTSAVTMHLNNPKLAKQL